LRKALVLFRKIVGVNDTTWSSQSLWQMALIYEQKHQYMYAVNHLKKILDLYPEYEHFTEVIDRLFQIATKLKSGKRPYYFGLIPGFKDYKSAIDFYQNVIQKAPSLSLAPQALMCIAEIEEFQKRPAKAIEALDQLIDQYPYSELSPEAYLQIARIYESLVVSSEHDQGALHKALNYYEDFAFLFPEHENCPSVHQRIDLLKAALARAKIRMADFYYFFQNNWLAADLLYGKALDIHYSSEIVQEVETKRQRIRQGISAPKCPIDFLFNTHEQDRKNQLWLKSIEAKSHLDFHEIPSFQNMTHKEDSSLSSQEKTADDFLPPFLKDSENPSLQVDLTQIKLTSEF
jgi:outer membrane protein assembly factor BamD (BamD/ComL family)